MGSKRPGRCCLPSFEWCTEALISSELAVSKRLFNSYSDPIPPLRFDVQIIPVEQNGESFLYFQDQYGYATSNFAVPESARNLLAFFDGKRSVNDIIERSSNGVTKEQVLDYVRFLDENALLHSTYFKEHAEHMEQEYEQGDVHPTILAGMSFPDDPEEVKHFLTEAFDKLPGSIPVREARALYAPHIDLRVGMNSYVKAFSAIEELKPKRVVILATSHYAGLFPEIYEEAPFVIIEKDFKLINGTIEADRSAMRALKEQISGSEEAYGVSFQDRAHRMEHSIESHLLFLNHLWEHDFTLVPILIGGLDELFYKKDGFQGKQVHHFARLLADLFGDANDTFFLISGDLAHVGRKFGDQKPAKELFEEIRSFDQKFLREGASGNAPGMLELMSEKYDPYRICGYPPLYTFLNVFPGMKGEILSYDIWDEEERESGVSFGSLLYNTPPIP